MAKKLQLLFLDLAGVIRSTETGYEEDKETHKALFDASSVYGFEEIHRSDLELRLGRRRIKQHPLHDDVYAGIANIYYPDGDRYVKDPRYVAEKAEKYVEEIGYSVKMGVEIEFFIFDELSVEISVNRQVLEIFSEEIPGVGLIPPRRGYHLVEPFDKVAGIRDEIIDAVEKIGYRVSKSHHEVATGGQVEVTSTAYSLLSCGDYAVWFKYLARMVAEEHGCTAVFLPKPLMEDNGSGMHIHVSLWRDDKNLFYDVNDEHGVSQLARYFIGGLLEHGRSLSALVSPTVNSYRRLVPGYEAPTILAWGVGNRSVAVRVPSIRSEKSFRVEYRPPDPLANPYLALSAVLLAGLDGVKKKIEPGEPLSRNAYELSEKEVRDQGYKQLPRSLEEALDELEADNEYLKPVFPSQVIESYIELKRREARELQSIPTPSEHQYYGYW